jgi:uncharacterized membrane protein
MTKFFKNFRQRYNQNTPVVAISDAGVNWRQPVFWRNIFLYFWVFSLVGHFVEVFWEWFTNSGFDPNNVPTITPLAAPYGFAVVAVILLVYPIYKRFKRPNILLIFILSALVTAAVEYLCAVVIVLFLGHNPFWDYSYVSYNLNGYICLHNVVLFGLASTLFIRFIFPHTERLMKKSSNRFINDLFILLSVTYSLDLLLIFLEWLQAH